MRPPFGGLEGRAGRIYEPLTRPLRTGSIIDEDFFGRNPSGAKSLSRQVLPAPKEPPMVAQMNRLEHAARIAMGDDLTLPMTSEPLPGAGLSPAGRLALLAGGFAIALVILAEILS
jgi:hypothetical protein